MDMKTIQLIAAIFGLLGGIILAYSLNKVVSEIGFAVNALATSIETVVSSRDVYIFKGLDKRLNYANSISNLWIRTGIGCMTISTILTAYSICAAP
jgi:hypothetical protein